MLLDAGRNPMVCVEALIEREDELVALGDILEAALSGRGRAVLVEGEAGIGKTRLLEAFRARASAAGVRVLYATADETDASVPLACARMLLARATRDAASDGPARLGVLALNDGLSDPSVQESRADEVVHALWWLVVELAEKQPLALFLDDAQWTDELSLRLMRMVARRAAELPLALFVAARPAAPGRRHSRLAAERGFVRVEPQPLSVSGTARLVEEIMGQGGPVATAARAHVLTAGNPLYLRELLEHARSRGVDVLSDDVAPPQLVRLVADRLERLTPAAAALARAVAVLATNADPNCARALAGLDATEASVAEEELRSERVLDARAYAFTHPLIAAATRDAIGAARAGQLHARAAALLITAGASYQRVAEHLMRAPPRGDATVVTTLRRAAATARRLGAPTTAARLLERAITEPPLAEDFDAVDFERARALLDADAEIGEQALTRVAQRARSASVRADAARHLARRLALDGRSTEAAVGLRAVVETLGATDRETRLELIVELAFVGSSDLSTHQEAARMIALEAQHAPGQTPGERLVLVAANVLRGENPADPAGAARELLALRLHRDYPGGFAVAGLTFSAAAMLVNVDALEDAERAMDALRADAEAMVAPYLIVGSLWQQAQIAYQRGDLPGCELECRATIEGGGAFGRSLATPWLVMTLTEQDRLDESERALKSAGMLGSIPDSSLLTAALGSRGRLRLAQGDARRAVDDLATARDRSAAWFPKRVEPPWQPLLVEALLLADRGDEAIAEVDAYAKLAADWGTRRALGHAARLRALNSPRLRAITLLEEAREHFAASQARLEFARCLTELGAHRRAAGDRRAARAILREAHDAAYACRATALCQRARAELLLTGGRPRPPAGAGAGALTPAERRVAEIAANGATNREIARRLYLSPKTVEMHLRSAYRKLDVAGRDALATVLH